MAQGSESADLKPGEPRVAGVYRCGKTVFQLQMDAAWDAAHGVLSYWMPGVRAMTPRVEYMDVMQAAELSLAAAAEKKWRRTDGGVATGRHLFWEKGQKVDVPASMRQWWMQVCAYLQHPQEQQRCVMRTETEGAGVRVRVRILPHCPPVPRQCMRDPAYACMPTIKSASPGKWEKLVVLYMNVRSLTSEKWKTVLALMLTYNAAIMALGEVWFEKEDVDMEIAGYRCIRGTPRGAGRWIIVWVRKDPGVETKVTVDTRHVLAVLVKRQVHHVMVAATHMPLRPERAAYTEELQHIIKLEAQHPGVAFIGIGDWNRHALTHDETVAAWHTLSSAVMETGMEGPLHKDWVMLPTKSASRQRVEYQDGVADHPLVAGMLVLYAGGAAAQQFGYRPVSVARWADTHRRKYGDIMEALSYQPQPVASWLLVMREVMAAISQRLTEEALPEDLWDRLCERLQQRTASPRVLPTLEAQVARNKWLHLVRERQTLEQGILTGETMRVIRLKKPFGMWRVTKVWDSEQQRVVQGEAVLPVVAREAAHRHPVPVAAMAPWEVRQLQPAGDVNTPEDAYTQVERARRRQQRVQSHGAIEAGVDYPYSVVETVGVIAEQKSNAAAMDGFVCKLQRQLGLRGILHMRAMLNAPYAELPPETLQAVHTPHKKPGKVGLDFNVISRPVLMETGPLRFKQKGHWGRVGRRIGSATLGHFQFAGVKGGDSNHLRRLVYTVALQHVLRHRQLVILLLDQTNAYGQLHRTGMSSLVESEPLMRWAWQEALYLLQALQVFVVTVYGLSPGYRIAGGAVQGGGMDPIFYIWFTLLLAVWFARSTAGVPIWTGDGVRSQGPQATVDDTVMMASNPETMQTEAEGAMRFGRWLNLRNNADKFGMLHFQPGHRVQYTEIQVDGEVVRSARRAEYVKLLGGDVNPFSAAHRDTAKMRVTAKQVRRRLMTHTPVVKTLNIVIRGVVINAWIHRKLVKWPADSLRWEAKNMSVACTVTAVANIVRGALRLPWRTPWAFIYCGVHGVGAPHPATCLWVRAVSALYSAGNSVHPNTRAAVQHELLAHWEAEAARRSDRQSARHAATSPSSDYGMLASWMHQVEWQPIVQRAEDADKWQCPLGAVPDDGLIIVGDVSTDGLQQVWGFGVVVGDVHGTEQWRTSAWIRATAASTTLMEATILHEATVAVIRACVRLRKRVPLYRWMDNQAGAKKLHRRTFDRAATDFLMRVLATDELLVRELAHTGWTPAEHDTQAIDLVALYNKTADDLARGARAEMTRQSRWSVPRSWCDGVTLFFTEKDHLIVDVKKAVEMVYQWDDAPKPRPWRRVPANVYAQQHPADQALLAAWLSTTFLRPSDLVYTRLYHWSADVYGLHSEDEQWHRCDLCDMRVQNVAGHQVTACPRMQGDVWADAGSVLGVLRKHQRASTAIHRTWCGIVVSRSRCRGLLLQWLPPGAQQWATRSTATTWVVRAGSVPHRRVVEEAKHLVHGDPRWVLLQCVRAAHIPQSQMERDAARHEYESLQWDPLWAVDAEATWIREPRNDLSFAPVPLLVAQELQLRTRGWRVPTLRRGAMAAERVWMPVEEVSLQGHCQGVLANHRVVLRRWDAQAANCRPGSVRGVFQWDPAFVAELERRGARVWAVAGWGVVVMAQAVSRFGCPDPSCIV